MLYPVPGPVTQHKIEAALAVLLITVSQIVSQIAILLTMVSRIAMLLIAMTIRVTILEYFGLSLGQSLHNGCELMVVVALAAGAAAQQELIRYK